MRNLAGSSGFYTVKYVRLPDLLLDLEAARENGNFKQVLKKYTNPTVLILDEWLLLRLTESEARNLFELIHKRRKKTSTIFCSQFREEEWQPADLRRRKYAGRCDYGSYFIRFLQDHHRERRSI